MRKIFNIALLLFPLLFIGQAKIKLVIDAGHGGTDPGNLKQTEGLKDEKDINLDIAMKLGGYVNQYLGHAIEVVYTRTTDEFIELQDRVKIANDANAHYFISIHCNASENKSVVGTETHIHLLENNTSNKLAHAIQDQFKKRAGRHSRGVKIKNDRLQNLYVLKETNMPAVLVECGFMTNPMEEAFLNSSKGEALLASAIFRAFRDMMKTLHGIEMKEVEEQKEKKAEKQTMWKIQIMASSGPVSLDNPDFLSLDYNVEELNLSNAQNSFTYKYYVGAFTSKKEAKSYLKKVKDGVFKDAFLVKFEE